jgi:uncharacterized protein
VKSFRDNDRLMIIVDKGEKLVESITQQAAAHELKGGLITGLGALTEVELGFYHLHKKDYDRKTFPKEYELISLMGNIAKKDGKPFVHVHAALGDEDFSVFGGHLFEARVAVTTEVSIVPFAFAPVRKMNPEMGLALICEKE